MIMSSRLWTVSRASAWETGRRPSESEGRPPSGAGTGGRTGGPESLARRAARRRSAASPTRHAGASSRGFAPAPKTESAENALAASASRETSKDEAGAWGARKARTPGARDASGEGAASKSAMLVSDVVVRI